MFRRGEGVRGWWLGWGAGSGLRSQGSSGKGELSRVARGDGVIASRACSGPIPLTFLGLGTRIAAGRGWNEVGQASETKVRGLVSSKGGMGKAEVGKGLSVGIAFQGWHRGMRVQNPAIP